MQTVRRSVKNIFLYDSSEFLGSADRCFKASTAGLGCNRSDASWRCPECQGPETAQAGTVNRHLRQVGRLVQAPASRSF